MLGSGWGVAEELGEYFRTHSRWVRSLVQLLESPESDGGGSVLKNSFSPRKHGTCFAQDASGMGGLVRGSSPAGF